MKPSAGADAVPAHGAQHARAAMEPSVSVEVSSCLSVQLPERLQMMTLGIVRLALSASVGAALLAACGGRQLPIGAPGAMPQSSAITSHMERGGSWMLPEAKSDDLLYVSDFGYLGVHVLTYPQGRSVGAIQVYGLGLCVDHLGDVYVVVNGQEGEIVEYSHGGSEPIKTLNDDGPYGEQYSPHGCAVDLKTGNLAVTNGDSMYNNVALYRKAQGPPAFYSIPFIGQAWFCGYDDRGNLYADGERYGEFKLAELPFHGNRFKQIHLDQKMEGAGGVEWERGYLAVGDSQTGNIYHVHVNGSKGTVIGSTSLSGSDVVWQFWIQGSKVIGPSEYGADVGIWKYPAGGNPIKTLYGFANPVAAVVSVAPPH
jgi:hypothetical protein